MTANYVYEPDVQTLIEYVLPRYIENEIYHSMLEAAASELAARMTAMDSATKNAAEMLDELTLIYNKVRQSNITKELLGKMEGGRLFFTLLFFYNTIENSFTYLNVFYA